MLKKRLFIFLVVTLFSLLIYKFSYPKIIESVKNQVQVIDTKKLSENISVGKVSEGLLLVSADDKDMTKKDVTENENIKKYGYVNLKMEEVIPMKWDYVSNIDRFGYIKTVDVKNGVIAIFDKTGKKIIEKRNLADIIPLEKEIFIFKDKNGEMKFSDLERYIYPISFSYIKAIGNNQFLIGKVVDNKKENIKMGVLKLHLKEKEMSKVLDTIYEGITKIDENNFFVQLNGKLYSVNTDEKNEPISKVLEDKIVYYDKKNIVFLKEKYHLIDFQGKTKGVYDYIGRFLYGKAVVKEGNNYGVINENGEVIIPVKYEFLAVAGENIFIFKDDENGKYGYINEKGEVIIPAKYEEVTSFYNDRAMYTEGDIVGVIDKKGNVVNKREYIVISEIKDNVAIGGTVEGFGAVNENGKEILEAKYEDLSFWGSKYIFGSIKNQKYIFDYEGKLLLELPLSEITGIYNNQVNIKDKIYLFKD